MSRSRLRGRSIEELRLRVLDEYGARARIVSAERVIQGGIRGFLAKRYYEVTVEVPEDVDDTADRLRTRRGLEALLIDAEQAEDRLARVPTTERAALDFDRVLDDLLVEVGEPGGAAPEVGPVSPLARDTAVPIPREGVGDLVLVVGIAQEQVAVARRIAAHVDARLHPAGATVGLGARPAVVDRRSALLARADAVGAGRALVCAWGLSSEPGAEEALAQVEADQVWAVVDAGRKADDSRRWIDRIRAVVHLDALAVIGVEHTATPATVDSLGVPIGWVDDEPAVSSRW